MLSPLGHILVAQKIITRRQLLSVLERHQRHSKLGELLVKTKALTTEQLATALAEQRRRKQALGEIVIRLKYVTEEQLRHALSVSPSFPATTARAPSSGSSTRAVFRSRWKGWAS